MRLIFTTEERIREIKKNLNKREMFELKSYADEMMELKEMSVTFHKSPAASGDIHDYYSEGPYWWPDRKNPSGPFIRRDGQVYPNRFISHHDDLIRLSEAVAVLSQAGLFLDEDKYFKKAIELICAWFLNKETKMNPNLNHAQAIRGICSGRGIGIIDACVLLRVIHGVNLIEYTGMYEKEISAFKEWVKEYITWLKTSENGIAEKNHGNNHSNWYNTQLAAYCAFTGGDLGEYFEFFKNTVMPSQTGEDGSFTDELSRTMSYHYTKYNLEASVLLCVIAEGFGVNLWNEEFSGGRSLKKSVEFFKPYYINPFLWKWQQISAKGDIFGEDVSMKIAARVYNDKEIDAANKAKRAGKIPVRSLCHIGIIDLV